MLWSMSLELLSYLSFRNGFGETSAHEESNELLSC
jgi:hypothetical protein